MRIFRSFIRNVFLIFTFRSTFAPSGIFLFHFILLVFTVCDAYPNHCTVSLIVLTLFNT